jgi:hypothetical protein
MMLKTILPYTCFFFKNLKCEKCHVFKDLPSHFLYILARRTSLNCFNGMMPML